MALSWWLKSVGYMDLNWWTLEDVWRKLRSGEEAVLSEDAEHAIERCHGFLQETIANSNSGAIYGVNTGFGDLAHTRVDSDSLHALQRNILLSHACGVGEDVPESSNR